MRVIDFMPPRGRGARRGADRRGRRGHRAACGWSSSSASTTARSCRGCAAPRTTRGVAIAGPDALALRTPVAMRGEDLRTVARVHRRSGRADAVRAHVVPVASGDAAGDRSGGGARRDRARSGGSGSAQRSYGGRVARRRDALADHAQGAHVRSPPAGSSPRRRPRCRSRSAAFATGTTATAGCATRRSPSTPCSSAGTTTRRRGATGCCARSPAIPTTSRSCTALPASAG